MVFRVVSQTTQQFGHSARWRSSLARRSALVLSSRKSLSSARNSLHVSKGVVSLAFEKTRESVPQLQAGAQQTALHGRNAEVERFGGFFSRKPVNITERKHGPVKRCELVH